MGIQIHVREEIGHGIGKKLAKLGHFPGCHIQLIDPKTSRTNQEIVLPIFQDFAYSNLLRPVRNRNHLKTIVTVGVSVKTIVGTHIQALLIVRQ